MWLLLKHQQLYTHALVAEHFLEQPVSIPVIKLVTKLVVVHAVLVGIAQVVVLVGAVVTTFSCVLFLTLAAAHVLDLTVAEQHKAEVVITAVTAGAKPVDG
jgi:hypothetical protein